MEAIFRDTQDGIIVRDQDIDPLGFQFRENILQDFGTDLTGVFQFFDVGRDLLLHL